MKQNKLFSYLYDFISQLLDNPLLFENIRRIVLFGSVARGDFTPESDVDIFIELKRKNSTKIGSVIKFEQNKFEIRAEKIWHLLGVHLPFRIIVGSLDEPRWKELKEEIKSHGKVIYGPLEENPSKLKSQILVSYELTKLSQKQKMAFLRKLYGYALQKSGKKYVFEGKIKELSGEKVGANNLIIPADNLVRLKQIFLPFKIKYSVRTFYS